MTKEEIAAYISDIKAANIESFKDKAADVESFRVKYLGKKGIIGELFNQLVIIMKVPYLF